MDQRLLDKKAMADHFGVFTRTVERWAAKGWLPKVAIGGVVRFRADDGETLVRKGLVTAR